MKKTRGQKSRASVPLMSIFHRFMVGSAQNRVLPPTLDLSPEVEFIIAFFAA
jgi:hypothetical protein